MVVAALAAAGPFIYIHFFNAAPSALSLTPGSSSSSSPGTAAALAATVAGLAVAIPSLFGYNWLNSRIKNITADNRVFVDEFVTRLAEQYS